MSKKFVVLALTGMLALAACSQGGGTTPTPNPTPNPAPGPNPNPNPTPTPTPVNSGISITSPLANSTVGNLVTIQYTTNGVVTNVQCGVQGGTLTPSGSSGTSGSCAVDLTGRANGPVTLVVSGKDADGNAVQSTVTVNLNNSGVGSTTSGVTFSPIMTVNPTTGFVDYSAYRDGGARLLPQQIEPPASGSTATLTSVYYLKGRVTLGFVPVANATRVEAYVSTTDTGPAVNYLYDGALNGTYVFDTTQLNGYQSRVLYLVTRTYFANGTSTTSAVPFVVDNTGPQAASPDFRSTGGANDRLLRDYGAPNANFARGSVDLFITNPNLTDLVLNPASGQNYPAGVDSVEYYFVPVTQLGKIPTVQGQARVDAIRANASSTITPKLPVVESAGPNRDYKVSFDSAQAPAGAYDGSYVVFAVDTDQLGNDTASTNYQNLAFDNVGPTVSTVQLLDSSPLPFPSADPAKYISDYFTVSGTISDALVGLAPGTVGGSTTVSFNFCGRFTDVPASFTPADSGSGYADITINSYPLDSNVVVPSDGQCAVTVSATDALGNTPAGNGAQTVTFDNTDPQADIQTPAQGQTFVAGTSVNFDNTVSDGTSGINDVFTKTYWNDYLTPTDLTSEDDTTARSRENGFVGAPVEFRTDPQRAGATSGTWTAVYPGQPANGAVGGNIPRGVKLGLLVVDKAGNATIQQRLVRTVLPNTLGVNSNLANQGDLLANYALPKLGDFDVYQRNTAPAYTPVPQTDAAHVQLVGAPATTTAFNPTLDFVGDMLKAGTFGRSGSNYAQLANLNYYRELLPAAWGQIQNYQTNASTIIFGGDPTLSVRAGSDLATRRAVWGQLTDGTTVSGTATSGAPITAPWFLIADTNSQTEFYRSISALIGTAGTGVAIGDNAFAGSDAIAALALDSSGQYSAVAEGLGVITSVNQTPASVLSATYPAGTSTVNGLQFVVTNSQPGNLNYSAAGLPNTYRLEARVGGSGAFTGLTDVTATVDGSPTDTIPSGIHQVKLDYTTSATKYTDFRFVSVNNAGQQFVGQIFNLNIQ